MYDLQFPYKYKSVFRSSFRNMIRIGVQIHFNIKTKWMIENEIKRRNNIKMMHKKQSHKTIECISVRKRRRKKSREIRESIRINSIFYLKKKQHEKKTNQNINKISKRAMCIVEVHMLFTIYMFTRFFMKLNAQIYIQYTYAHICYQTYR